MSLEIVGGEVGLITLLFGCLMFFSGVVSLIKEIQILKEWKNQKSKEIYFEDFEKKKECIAEIKLMIFHTTVILVMMVLFVLGHKFPLHL